MVSPITYITLYTYAYHYDQPLNHSVEKNSTT